jgi:hypothetical protein
MATRYEQTEQDYEPLRIGHTLRVVGGTALASIAIAGGATVGWAYNDLRQGVDGPVLNSNHAETHALQAPDGNAVFTVDPASFDIQAQTYSVVFAS